MADSIIAICNRALSKIGTQSKITSLDEASVEANQCALWYDNLRRQLLRTAPWGFARQQLALTMLGNITDASSPYPWLVKYAYPSDCLKLNYIISLPCVPAGAITPPSVGLGIPGPTFWGPSRSNRFIIANDKDSEGNNRKVILSNVPTAIGVYAGNIEDPNLFDDLFDGALTDALAVKLIVPLSGNIGMHQSFEAALKMAIDNARAADGNESLPTTDHVVDWMATRGVGSPYGYGAFGANGGAVSGWGEWNSGWDNFSWGM